MLKEGVPPGVRLIIVDNSTRDDRKTLKRTIKLGQTLSILLTPEQKRIVSRVVSDMEKDLKSLR